MASRPLPPGRRGRGPRVASGLHHLPEPKLLDVATSHTTTTTAAAASSTTSNATETSVRSSPTGHEPEPTPSTAPAAALALAPLRTASSTSIGPVVDAPHARAPPPTVPTPAPAVVAPPPVVADVVQDPAPHHVKHVAAALEASTAVHQPLHTAYTHEAPVSAPPTPAARREPAIAAPAPAPASVPAPEPSAIGDLGPFDPVALLLPVDAVPDVPGSIECLYDDAAVAMQKRVLKVVRKLVGKDKSKLEDFKINSRLFGNSFMEPHEYLESLVQDFGAIRALQFVPSLLTIQADYMKRAGLLLAARNYRMRHLAALETQVAAMRAAAVVPAAASQAPVSLPTPVAEVPSIQSTSVPVLATAAAATTAAVVAATEQEAERVENHVALLAPPVADVVAAPLTVDEPQGNNAVDDERAEPADVADVVAAAADQVLDAVVSAPEEDEAPVSSATAVAALIGAVAPPTEQSKTVELHATTAPDAGDDGHASDAAAAAVAEVEVAQVASPKSEATPVLEPVATPSEPLPVSAPTLSEPTPPVQTASAHREVAEPAFSISDLPLAFQQAFASPEPSPKYCQAPPAAAPAAAVAAPVKRLETESSSSSFAEAENLFGERFSTGSTSSDNAETLFGESIYHPAAAAAPAAPTVARDAISKPVHSQLLFGFATAGADSDSDSDSDDSGFSPS